MTSPIVDYGSGITKAGPASAAMPTVQFPSMVGERRSGAINAPLWKNLDCYVGADAQEKRGALNLRHAIEHGVVTNWDDTESLLSLYAEDRNPFNLLDSGDGVSHTVPVYEGIVLTDAIERIDIAGDKETVRQIKEKYCYVARNYEKETASSPPPKPYKLPDEETIALGNERFQCPEALFNTTFLGGNIKDSRGIHKVTYDSIMKCDRSIRKLLFANIVLSGGTTMCKGLPDRLKTEIAALHPSAVDVRISAPDDRKCSVWIGGSKLARKDYFNDLCISRNEYSEIGPSIVKEKF